MGDNEFVKHSTRVTNFPNKATRYTVSGLTVSAIGCFKRVYKSSCVTSGNPWSEIVIFVLLFEKH